MGSLGPTSKSKVSPRDIDAIKQLLAGTSATVVTPDDSGYHDTIKRWSMAASKPAGVSILPTTADEVAKVVKYASENNLDLAVKGGGHSTAGASSTDGGLLFDLGKMRKVTFDKEREVLVIGGGANWGDVDEEAYKFGYATVGGTVMDTGVGGLTLGGGYGWLSGQYGLVIDNLLEVELVLASGEIIRASKTQNPDLFWALSGAGQNFGVATEFVLQAKKLENTEVWAGMLVYPPAPGILEKLVTAVNNLYMIDPETGKTKVNGKGGGGLGFARPPDAGGATMILTPVIYFGTKDEAETVYKELIDIGPVANTTTMVPYPTINNLLAPPYGLRASMKGAAFELPIRPEFAQKNFDEYTKFMDANPDAGISMLLWELFDPAKINELDHGCFANRGLHFNGMICPIWTDPKNDQTCRLWAREMNEMWKKELEEHSSKEVGGGGEAPASVVGKKRATQFYGNYDHYDERSRDILGRIMENYRA
ncbi:6-hydroxy-D-nicotine oxidase [Cyphellophora attinorum]|uniref:6-hydroxy-D-nicotine oxidase n=1 Tax=Cyphellophora attinorum TaxID=1664694 RepID=A0A0N0NMH4_9EURO|nr:6-hydroxy-D-nicotine oxidase [Phialophora attinorum]KPI40358.1 6-hydroxy-D-nicotine oxidase [Phialophora attinorum]